VLYAINSLLAASENHRSQAFAFCEPSPIFPQGMPSRLLLQARCRNKSQVSLWFTDLRTTTGLRRRIQLSCCRTSARKTSSSSSSSATSAGDIKLFPLAQGPRHHMPAGARQALGILTPYHHQQIEVGIGPRIPPRPEQLSPPPGRRRSWGLGSPFLQGRAV